MTVPPPGAGHRTMDLLVHRPSAVEYSEDTAHTIEVIREEDESGEFGSFGFTLLYEKPPIVGTIVPGGPAERASLKKNDIVLAVNGADVTGLPHQKVVNIISLTLSAGVWLKICDPDTNSKSSFQSNNLGRSSNFSMSSSTPNFPRGMPSVGSQRRTGVRGAGGAIYGEPPPKYSEVPPNRSRPGSGVANPQLGGRTGLVSVSTANMSPLNRQVLMTHPKANMAGISISGGQPLQNGYGSTPHRFPGQGSGSGGNSSSSCFTSASVMVLYIGPVEIPDTWSTRGISSKCIQECTRRLLSQRQEFIEAFLEVSTASMKVLNVSRNVLYRHKREELFYCGTCTDDEQYFAIVTRKIDPKLVDPEVGQTLHVPGEKPVKAHICHVFQVIRNKSVLVLHAGDKGGSGETPNVKPKTVPIMSCLTIIKAIESLFIGEATGGSFSSAVLFGESETNSCNTSFRSTGSEGSNGSGDSIYGSSGDKQKRRKDVVDLRPVAFSQINPNTSSSSLTYGSSGNTMYTTHEAMNRSRDFLHPMDTPAYNSMSSSGKSWYRVESPKEAHHSRQGSYDGHQGSRPDSGNYNDIKYEATTRQQQQLLQDGRKGAFEKIKKISDESSISSLSSGGGTSSPSKMPMQSRTSHSPSPSKSLSYSSGSRSRSPSPSHPKFQRQRSPSPRPGSTGTGRGRIMMTHRTPSKLSAGLALEIGSRNGAISPTSTLGSVSRYRMRRQGSENSIMDLQQVDGSRSGGLPAKNSLLSSSHGSMVTVTTLAEEGEGEEEEVGRVAGWIASFDKLLADSLGVICLQQFLEKEHCEENILFWKDAKDFAEKSQRMTNVQILAAAKKIYEQYLSPSSPHTVNVDDRAMKAVESRLANPPPSIFSEAKEQIYQLLKMDCYMRFKRSDLVKECLLADMEGNPLPIGPAPQIVKNPWKKQKEFGFGRSLFSRIGRNRVPPSPPLQAPSKNKKDSKAGVKESPGSKKASRDTRQDKDKRRSGTEVAHPEEFPPEKHLDILQAHKGNIFEVNLPNKFTKIMEVPKRGNVREAIDPVLRKNNYSLDVMDLKFADTLKPVNLDSPAHILIGQHIIVLKSAHTFIAMLPDGPERILPAGKRPVRDLVAEVLNEMEKLQNFTVSLENSRVPFDGSIEASTLVGQRVTVKYLGGQYMPAENNMENLISMIERLAGDTLEDQRTSPTPRNTPEPSQNSPELLRLSHSNSSSFKGPGLSPRSSDSSPEARSKMVNRRRANSSNEKKPLSATRSTGIRGDNSSRRFKRSQSGAVVSQRHQHTHDNVKRAFSPPTGSSDRQPSPVSPPPPTSRPPALPSSALQQQQQYSLAKPAQRRAHRSSEELLQDSTHYSSGGVGPKYFPRAYPTLEHEQHQSLGNSNYGSYPERLDGGGRGPGPVIRQVAHHSSSLSPGNEHSHPLDSFVNEASVAFSPTGHSTTGASHGRQHSMPVQMPTESERPSMLSSYPWHQAQPPKPRRYTQQQQPRTAAQRHHLTQNPDLIRTGDQLVQQEIDEYRHKQLTSSTHSSHSDGSSSVSVEQRTPLSPTTHILLLPEEDSSDQNQIETFV